MPQVRNIEAVLPGYVEVTTPDKVYRLRDDIGTQIALYAFRLLNLENALPTFEDVKNGSVSVRDIALAKQALDEERRAVCGEIFRFTYPQMTDDEVGELLPPKAQDELVRHFFSLHLTRYGAQPSAPDASAAEPSSQTTTSQEQEPAEAASDSVTPSASLPTASRSTPATTPKRRT
jgi:hypothetical protein